MRLKQNPKIIDALLKNESLVTIEKFENEVFWGNQNSDFIITIVTNATCGPCRSAHAAMERLLGKYKEKVRVVYRLLGDRNPESISAKVSKHIIGIASVFQNGEGYDLLSDWFKQPVHDVNTWLTQSKNEYNLNAAEEVYKRHSDWSLVSDVNSTPTFFINGKRLPQELSISDLKFYLREKLEN